jgi:hypothetical protein
MFLYATGIVEQPTFTKMIWFIILWTNVTLDPKEAEGPIRKAIESSKIRIRVIT